MLIFGFPIQTVLILIIIKQREKGVKITDKRVRLTTEVLQGIRLIKMYGWEAFYYQQISNYRENEIKTVRKSSYGLSFGPYFMYIITSHIFFSFAVAWLMGLFMFMPVLASLLSFVGPHLAFPGGFNAFLDYIQPNWTRSQHSCHLCFLPTFQCRNCLMWLDVNLSQTVYCRSSACLSSSSHSSYQIMQVH